MAKVQASEADEPEDAWMVRPCDFYYEEYSDCTSIKARFHQYFIFGKPIDCIQWKKDYDNCSKWKNDNDIKACQEVILSEKKRRFERLKPHFDNNVWEKRTEPPTDWNKPLPEWMEERFKNTYLDHKSKEISGEIPRSESERTLCVIS